MLNHGPSQVSAFPEAKRNGPPKKSADLVFNTYSRITAALYIVMAKRMGFTGILWRSKLEGEATISLAPPAPPSPGSNRATESRRASVL